MVFIGSSTVDIPPCPHGAALPLSLLVTCGMGDQPPESSFGPSDLISAMYIQAALKRIRRRTTCFCSDIRCMSWVIPLRGENAVGSLQQLGAQHRNQELVHFWTLRMAIDESLII